MTEPTYTLHYHGNQLVINRRDLVWIAAAINEEVKADRLKRLEEQRTKLYGEFMDVTNRLLEIKRRG